MGLGGTRTGPTWPRRGTRTGPTWPRRGLLLGLTAALGCSSLHSTLEADLDADYDVVTEYEAPCLIRTPEGQIGGTVREFELGKHEDGPDLVAIEDGAQFWGQGTTGGGVRYAFGQLCHVPQRCEDYLFFDDGKYRVWMQVETVRAAEDAARFQAQLDEGRLIEHGATLVTNEQQRGIFDRVARELESAEASRTALWKALLPDMIGEITNIGSSITTVSALLDAQILLAGVWRFLEEHNVMLYGGRGGGLRAFEVVRMICVSSTRPPVAL